MRVSATSTLAEIASSAPATIPVFESFGLDYCCGGRRRLDKACREAGIAEDRLIAELETAAADRPGEAMDWSAAPVHELVDHIVARHHSYVKTEIPRIETLLSKVAGRHQAKHPELVQVRELFLALASELSSHLMKEEQILFPYIRSLSGAGEPAPACFGNVVDEPISRMVAEHEDAAGLLEKIRELTASYETPEGACTSFVALYQALDAFEKDLHRHVHLENNVLFPRTLRLASQRPSGQRP